MDWLRWYAGTSTDPKWRVVAVESGQPVAVVLAVWAMMLERASASEERGCIDGWNDRVAGAALDVPADAVEAIRGAMQGLVLDGNHLSGWEKRQPKREDGSAERSRAWREKKKQERTQANAPERNRPLEESRREESREKKKNKTRAYREVPDEWEPTEAHRALASERGVKDLGELEEKFRAYVPNRKEPYRDLDAAFRTFILNAKPHPNGNGKEGGQTYDEWFEQLQRELH